ncbi:MAG: dihydrolipoyl dehydrogenase [Desulfurella sp.]|uniref:dihydrolipoyl dehydrogenase n=1 Tax=Desulfurella sp. TaxID=1962857 RepID=UPI000CBE1464|nr:dihydrolipoyl dehydrogenase [Desulfurella sp.]PMP91824.1 MAG: dihydrolipoyl dehydrogenase [Desulfurella sp.]
MEEKVDVLTIGAGAGAYPAAFRLAKAGKRVIMVDEKGVMSGNCLAEGCVPSKSIRQAASFYRYFKKSHQFGIFAKDIVCDYKKVIEYKNGVQNLRYTQHAQELEEAKPNLALIKGTAEFLDEHRIKVLTDEGEKVYYADYIIIASGAKPFILPIEGSQYCVTSTDIYKLNPPIDYLPKSIIILGAGYISLETATIFNELGSKVTVIQRSNRVLTEMDETFAKKLYSMFDPNIDIRLGTKLIKIQKNVNDYSVFYEQNGQQMQARADLVMMAFGRVPVIPKGAENLGLKITKKGIESSPSMQTNIKHIYSSGDINGKSMLFHSATRQSLVAANNILANNTPIDYMDYSCVPNSVFTFPEAAFVGILPDQAKAMGIDILETSFDLSFDAKAQILTENKGEIRQFYDAKSLKLIGAWIIGEDASTLIGELGVLIQQGAKLKDVAEYANQHPSTAEGISKAARKLL